MRQRIVRLLRRILGRGLRRRAMAIVTMDRQEGVWGYAFDKNAASR
jgi:hypothetical protein